MGMCKAVGNAVSSGATVSSILAESAGMSQADQKVLLTALYAASAGDIAIRASAAQAKIPDSFVSEAFNTNQKQGCVDGHSLAQQPAAGKYPIIVQHATIVQPAEGPIPESAIAAGRNLKMGEYWTTFYKNYKRIGIEQAVILAITEGIQPAAVLEGGLALEDMNPQNLIKAMYCAGYNGDDIKKACDQSGVSELVLLAGFKKSKVECRQDCREPGEDTQAYTPADPDPAADTQPYTAPPGPTMTGVPSPSLSDYSYASPSTF